MISPRAQIRRWAKRGLLDVMQRLLETDEGRTLAVESLNGTLAWRPPLAASLREVGTPYPEVGQIRAQRTTASAPIIITARFRTGSTLVWNLFRQLAGVTAYYEPFNERRWFDQSVPHGRVDPSHRHVTEYWSEYAGLRELGRYHSSDWGVRHLLMDSDAWNPSMRRYVELLIERAPGRAVLQFNQIDFRLPWFRRHFPDATLVHLYRHPRDQWCSSLLDPARFSRDAPLAAFADYDEFYLLAWARDLKHHFPFLDERSVSHPYELFYFLWKLSYLFGLQYGDYSFAFEDLVGDPRQALASLFQAVDLAPSAAEFERLVGLVDPPPRARWREYAADDWFREQESRCEAVLADFFLGQPA